MRLIVVITEPAESDIQQAYEYISLDSRRKADKWIDGLLEAMESLAIFPTSHQIARESDSIQRDLRQYIYKSHRIVFQINRDKIEVLAVIHAARRNFTDEPINNPDQE